MPTLTLATHRKPKTYQRKPKGASWIDPATLEPSLMRHVNTLLAAISDRRGKVIIGHEDDVLIALLAHLCRLMEISQLPPGKIGSSMRRKVQQQRGRRVA